GETGVDLYWETKNKDLQIGAFERQIEWAKEMDLPVIIHSRESLDLNLDIIERNQDGNLRGIFHCFGGNHGQAKRIEELGFKAGIGGVVTFKNSSLEKTLPDISPHLIVLETDSPYLAPTPYRGKRNEPSYLVLIAQKVADILGMSMKEVADLTTFNANEVFRKKS
ncbi:MAG TPA: TatD family hydrolase, partial [Saprospiraceae bacterium]|nr:TatD family hydrolase [Saprospiraceae bacterium]